MDDRLHAWPAFEIVAEMQRLIDQQCVTPEDLGRRLTVEDLELLREKVGPETDISLTTRQRLIALIELAQERPARIADASEAPRDEDALVIAPHGTVAHEIEHIRLLLVEFDVADAIEIRTWLDRCRETRFEVTRVESVEDAPALLADGQFDVGLIDLTSATSEGTITLARAEVVASRIPIVSLIERVDEPQMLHLGARDYLIKRQMNQRLLSRTLSNAVERSRLREELQIAREREHFHATRDAMTGLPNRFHFCEQLARAIDQADRHGWLVSVLFLDLDRFKHINDTLGHEVGDGLLITMADRLSSIVRRCDLAARVGGDEFLLLIQGTDADHAPDAVATHVLSALSRPFQVDGRQYSFTGSVGVAVYPRDGHEPEELIRKADAAMYEAKGRGRNNYQLYNRALNAAAQRRLALEGRLRAAIEGGHLAVHYQPRIDLRENRVVGLEALARWTDPEFGEVSPSEFIPIAEDSGIIDSIGAWVLETACAQMSRWCSLGFGNLRIAVNFSARQLRDDSIRDVILDTLLVTGLQPRSLEVELTETTLIEDRAAVPALLGELAELGIGISLDDFGTGFSSLGYLRRFPIDTIKIDQSFIRDLASDADDVAITEAIISIAEKLRLRVVAEGVETEIQRDFLRRRGCFEMQGYLFSEPLAADTFFEYLQGTLRAGQYGC